MKIVDRHPTGVAGLDPGRTGETGKSGSGAGPGGHDRRVENGDRVEVSRAAGRIWEAMESAAAGRAEKLESLRADYESGKYRPDALSTSRSLVEEALSAGAA